MLDRVDPLARGADRHHFARQKQIRVRFVFGATDAAAKLIKIGQAETIRAIDDDCVRVWNIETALNDRGANKHVDFSGDKTGHDFFKLVGVHLPVPNFDARVRDKIDNLLANPLDGLNAVVQKINLTLTFEFAIDRVSNNSLVVTANDCFDWQTVERRRFDRGHVLRANEREIKCARNRRG